MAASIASAPLASSEGVSSKVYTTMKSRMHIIKSSEPSAETPLRVSYAAFLLMFERHSLPAWICDATDSTFLSVNPAALRVYNYSLGEFQERTVGSIESDGTPAAEQSDSSRSAGKITRKARHLRKDGSTMDVEISSAPITFNGREAILESVVRIADPGGSLHSVDETDARYRDLFDHSNDLVFTSDLDGNLTSINKAGETITGFTAEEASRMDITQLLGFPSRDLLHRLRDAKPFEPREAASEVQIARKDGHLVTLSLSVSATQKDGKMNGIRGIARDITQHRELEDRLRQSQKMEALGRLAGGVAHDFNNLLGVIIGYTEVLADHLEAGGSMHSYLGETLKAGRQAAALTQQLLAFSRNQVLQPKVIDLNASIASMEQLLRRLVREDIELNFSPSPDLWRVKADPGQVHQVILNLCVNARDAMPHGGELTIETSNLERQEGLMRLDRFVPAGKYVLLTVSDTGVGMDEATRARVFEPFFTTKQVGKGTGLGLATVYGIVKQSGGYISVQSQPGNGCTFRIYLPSVHDAQPLLQSAAAPAQTMHGTQTILVVEDSEPFGRLVKMLLESGGYEVLLARTGAEASQLAAIHVGPIHILLTDVVMPQIDGYQLSDHLRFLRPDMRILYMSGYAAPAVPHNSSSFRAHVLPKPFCKEALLAAVRQALDEERVPDELAAQFATATPRGHLWAD